MGCQKDIATQIVEGGGDYILAAKDNQPHLLADIQECLTQALDADFEGFQGGTYQTQDKGHGRQETRTYTIVVHPEGIRNQQAWTKLKVVGMCLHERVVDGQSSDEVHYFIGSRVMSVRRYGAALRGHWGIENNLHWQLDVVFGEDDNRVQRRHGAENLAVVRRLAVGLLKRHPGKESVACKRYSAALDAGFLEEILEAGCNLENE